MKLYRIILLSIVVCFAACRKDTDNIDQNPGNNPPAVYINGSVLGLITDEAGNALSQAEVSFDGQTVYTDDFGNFIMNNQTFNETATSIQVSKEGYFNSSRTFYPKLNETSHITLAMMEKVQTGTLTTGETKDISTDGVNINFETPAFVDDSGATYEGDVNVFVRWLNPTDENLANIMPGDLVGIDEESNLNALQSFGMIGVELESATGESLELAADQTATITLDVPASMQSTAPATIPLWHFNEVSGLWEEEGEANLENGKYVGTVSHFSFWNCDAPYPLITLSGVVNGPSGGIENLKVQITDLELNQSGCGHTTNRGFFSGKVPKGHPLLLEVLGPCGDVLYAEEIGSFDEDTEIPAVFISFADDVVITGTLTNCNDDAINQGYVHVTFESSSTLTISLNDDQSFEATLLGCATDNSATAVGVDITNSLVSAPTDFNMTEEVSLTLEACEEYYTPGVYVDFNNGGGFAGNNNDSTGVYNTYTLQEFGTHQDYQITVLDWFSANVVMEGSVIVTPNETDVQYEFEFPLEGFTINGVVTGGIVNQGIEVLHVSDITQNITVDDQSLFDSNITEVSFTLNIEL